MGAFVVWLWVWVWVSTSQKIPLSVLAQNPHKGFAREISHETGRRQGKEGPRENREGSSQEKEAELTSRWNRAVGRREQELEPMD